MNERVPLQSIKREAVDQRADADWQKRFELHAQVCGCPWGPKTDIFGEAR